MKKSDTLYAIPYRARQAFIVQFSLALFFCFVAYASPGIAQNVLLKRVSVDLVDVSLKEALLEIEDKGEISFVYSGSQLPLDDQVTIQQENQSLGSLLDTLFGPIDIKYQVQGTNKHIVLSLKGSDTVPTGSDRVDIQIIQQDGTISGKVIDIEGIPLLGVTVLVKDTGRGTTTDMDGNYSILADQGEILEFRLVGFRTKEATIGMSTSLNMVLEEDIIALNEVVVSTGYQEIPKERATGSFVYADEERLDNQIGVISISEKIQGLIPGVLVEGNRIVIRGQSTINADASPVIVVDGFPTSLSLDDINPNDIDNITVLRDAAAASIWGVRASNGVIVITTKKGKTGSKPRFSYTSSLRITERPDISALRLADSHQYIDAELEALDRGWVNLTSADGNSGNSRVFEIYKKQYDGDISPEEAERLYNQLRANDSHGQSDLFFRNSISQQHDLSMSGATEVNNYYASLNIQDNTFESVGNSDTRVKFNLKNTYQIHPRIALDANISISYAKGAFNGVGTYSFVRQKPYELFVDGEGDYVPVYDAYRSVETNKELEELGYYDWNNNLKRDVDNGDNTTRSFSPKIITGLTAQLLDGLRYEGRFMYETRRYGNETFFNEEMYKTRDLINKFTTITGDGLEYQIPRGPLFEYTNTEMQSHTLRNQLIFSKNYKGTKHRVNALLGTEITKTKNNLEKGRYFNYDKNLLTYSLIDEKTLAEGVPGWNGFTQRLPAIWRPITETENRYFSYYFNGAYTYGDRYTFSASGRIDKSNLFGADANDRVTPLYSIGFSWNVANEDFFDVGFINALKIRATTGENGNVDKSTSKVLVATPETNSYSTGEQFLKIEFPENKELKWESTKSYNVGIDLGMFNNRLSLVADYYIKKSYDLLAYSEADPSLGFSSVYRNTASVGNKGIDIGLGARIFEGDFGWNLEFNISKNTNEVTKVYNPNPTVDNYLTGGYGRQIEGFPIDYIYNFRWAGLSNDGHPQIYDHEGNVYSSEDSEVDPQIEWLSYAGSTAPKYFGSVINTFRYKGLRLNTIFTYKFGHVMRLPTVYVRGSDLVLAEVDNRWRQPGDENRTDIPRMYDVAQQPFIRSQFSKANDHRTKSASFVRLNNVNLIYDFPKGILGKEIQSLQLQAQATNVALWTRNDRNIDPEAINLRYGDLSLPSPSIYTFGIRVGF
ncbi:SusC/RagA family TonB-linked outer membrane protein [Flagellimonas olearia]|nr:SusC/RagA family TonB-linked outer membrane protein [Allomuricauda olearia]